MTTAAPLPDGQASSDPQPLAVHQSNLLRWATPALSIAILAAICWQLFFRGNLDLAELRAAIPTSPLFWVVFAVYYFAPVIADFTIFRRLWGIPAEGFIALTRKQVGNELIVDYLGEAYFYGWARKKLNMATSPFGAVKDVAILSALVANVCTLTMIAVAYPYARNLDLGVAGTTLAWSLGLVVVISILVVVFGRRLFSLPKADLWWIALVHFLRVVATTGLIAFAWSLALPNVALGWWILLATVRLLLSRLPLISNKDVVFAGVAVFLLGNDTEIKVLMAVMATIALATHLLVGAVLAIGDLIPARRLPKKEAL